MKKLLQLKSFQKVLFWVFVLGVIIGANFAMYLFSPVDFNLIFSFLIFITPLFFIVKGLYKETPLFIKDYILTFSNVK